MHKAGKSQSCSVKGDPGERRLTSSKVASWYQLDSLSVGTSSNVMIFMENFHEFSGKPQRIAISMSVSQDDQHKEAELGELKSLMSDEYFRVGIPDGHRCGPMGCGTDCLSYHDTASGVSESKTCRWFSVLATWNLLEGHHAANCGRAWLWPPWHCFPGANGSKLGIPFDIFFQQTRSCSEILRFQHHLCISVPFSHGMFINPLGDEDSHHGNGQVHLVRRQGFHL